MQNIISINVEKDKHDLAEYIAYCNGITIEELIKTAVFKPNEYARIINKISKTLDHYNEDHVKSILKI